MKRWNSFFWKDAKSSGGKYPDDRQRSTWYRAINPALPHLRFTFAEMQNSCGLSHICKRRYKQEKIYIQFFELCYIEITFQSALRRYRWKICSFCVGSSCYGSFCRDLSCRGLECPPEWLIPVTSSLEVPQNRNKIRRPIQTCRYEI